MSTIRIGFAASVDHTLLRLFDGARGRLQEGRGKPYKAVTELDRERA